ncbi:MAG: endonuclease/exonuclease/phosphatase family protein [Planctomycetota bacterium]
MGRYRRWVLMLLVIFTGSSAVLASWDPAGGDWSKNDPRDLRVMTWNVHDGIVTTAVKQEGLNAWTAIAMILASLRPDVLIMQETGDTGSGVDPVPDLLTTIDLLFHGGFDPFTPGNPAVTAFVCGYAPAYYDLPFVFVSSTTDGYNRNVILSRYPFWDLNGDGKSQLSDTPFIYADEYAPGGNGGIRGFVHAEIDLPDWVYAGNLVIGNSHLKAGSGSDDKAQRLAASQNIAYYIDYLYNGAGTGQPDPHGKIVDYPVATRILSPETLLIAGGDWNEDEQSNGRKGPAEWITMAERSDPQGGGDGADRDRTDMTYDDAREFFSGSRATYSSSKLDYVSWQDSIGVARIAFIFNSARVPQGSFPPELEDFPVNPALASGIASDHFPVIVDFALPPAGCVHNFANIDGGDNGRQGPVAHQAACGGLGGRFRLEVDRAPPRSPVLLAVASAIARLEPRGVIIAVQPRFLGPLITDERGCTFIDVVPDGNLPAELYVQCIATGSFECGFAAAEGRRGVQLSNMIRVRWSP